MLNPHNHIRHRSPPPPQVPAMHSLRHLHPHRSKFHLLLATSRHFPRLLSSYSSTSGPDEPSPMVSTFHNPLEGTVITQADKPADSDDGDDEEDRRRGRSGKGRMDVSAILGKKVGKGKEKTSWLCQECGATTGQWWGKCRFCGASNSVRRFTEYENKEKGTAPGLRPPEAAIKTWVPKVGGEAAPQRLTDVNRGMSQSAWRLPLSGHFGMEVSRVLGGGVVPGSLILVGGDPGIGKSTLLLQVAAILSEGFVGKDPGRIMYVSGEESIDQIGNRADRMGITTPYIYLYSSTDIEDMMEKIQGLSPQALIVDSIQTVYLTGVAGSAGNVMQVKECTSAFLRFAKQTNIPVFLIGHVTKTGDIAGPRILEHIVDVVLYMEGERCSSYRLLRSVKNRFGSTDELGVFEMSRSGLQAVLNPSEMFLSENHSDSEILAGLAVAVIVDGSRTFLLEVQALCVSGSSVSRQVNGIPANRADMIISVSICYSCEGFCQAFHC